MSKHFREDVCMDIDKTELTDVSGLVLDNEVPYKERAEWMEKAVRNPYCYCVGSIGVKVEFMENAPVLQESFTEFLKRKKSGV